MYVNALREKHVADQRYFLQLHLVITTCKTQPDPMYHRCECGRCYSCLDNHAGRTLKKTLTTVPVTRFLEPPLSYVRVNTIVTVSTRSRAANIRTPDLLASVRRSALMQQKWRRARRQIQRLHRLRPGVREQ